MGRGPNATVVTLTQGMSLTAEMLHSYQDVKPGTFNYIPDDKATKLHIEFLGGAITNKNDFQIRFSGKVPVKSPFNIFNSADTELSNTIKNSATFFNDSPKLGKAAAPTSLTATPGNVKATISFTAGSANGGTISNYEYQLDGGSWVALDPKDATSPITITGLTNGTTYSVKLRAVTEAGAGTESAAVSVTPNPDPPAAPTIGTITSGNQQLSVAFTEGDNGGAAITNYSYSTDGTTYTAFSPAQTTSPLIITGLTNGTSYNITIKAINSQGSGEASSSASGTPYTVPGAPTITSATPGNASAEIAFTAPASNGGNAISTYEYQLGSGSWVSANTTSSPFTISSLTNGQEYKVKLRAKNAAGTSIASNEVSVTPRTVPGAPTGVTGVQDDLEAAVMVSWTAPASNGGSPITQYTVDSSPGFNGCTSDSTPPATSCKVGGLTRGTAYTFTVTAWNEAGFGAASSASQSFTIPVKIPQTITFGAISQKTWGDADFDLGPATTDQGQTVTFTAADTTIVKITGNKATLRKVGSTKITATQEGSALYFPATPIEQTLTVIKASQTITFAALADKTFEDPEYEVGPAQTDKGQPITYTSSDPTIVSITGNKATLLKGGSVIITASQAGDAFYEPATPIDRTLKVNKAAQTITFGVLADKTYEDPEYELGPEKTAKGLTITYVSSDPTIVSITGNKATLLKGGTVTITASQAGDERYLAAPDVKQDQLVKRAPQTIAFLALADYTYLDPPIDFGPAQSNKNLPVVYTSSMPNVVSVSGTTGTILRGGPVLQNGDIEPVMITASQAGDERYLPAEVTWPVTVFRAPQRILFSFVADKTYGDAPFALNPTQSDVGLPVTFTTADPSILSVQVNRVSITGTGEGRILINQAGDERYLPATEFTASVTVLKAPLKLTPLAGQGKDYGSADPAIAFEASGFGYGQDASILTGGLGRESGEQPGLYQVTLGDLGFDAKYETFYTLVLEPATFQVRIIDADGDLVPDHIEDEQGTDKSDPRSYRDTDADRVPDYVEQVIDKTDHTNSLEYRDTDGDLVPDYVEDREGSDRSNPKSFLDTDKGGVPDYVEEVYFVNAKLAKGDSNNRTDDGRDFDGDGVTDYREFLDGSNPFIKGSFQDSDGDGVPDEVEEREGTDPSDPADYRDTDNDRVPNYVETVWDGTDPDDPFSYIDADGDLVPNYVENRDGTDASDPRSFRDTDKGGMPDYVETVYLVNLGYAAYNPDNSADDGRDSDGDGVSDYRELRDGTDPADANEYADADGDRVPDEVEERDGTDPNDGDDYIDTDADRVPNYVEDRDRTDAGDPRSFVDADGDLVPNYVEDRDGTDTSDPSKFKDTDKGGTPDYVETVYFVNVGLAATNPNQAGDDGRDTDGDGKADYAELRDGTNPLDGDDFGLSQGTGSCRNPYDPYIVRTLSQLNSVRLEPDKCYLQAAHIDARPTKGWNNGRGFDPIGSESRPFSGSYDGAGHRIYGLHSDVSGGVGNDVPSGLFGRIASLKDDHRATVSNVRLDSVYVAGTGMVGALAGYAQDATLSSIAVSGVVLSQLRVAGGIVGRAKSVELSASYSQARVVSQGDHVGGVAGEFVGGLITDVYFAGELSAPFISGGIIGLLENSSIKNTYNIGITTGSGMGALVGRVVASNSGASYWDITSTNISSSAIGEPRTTVQMMDPNSFSGWAFGEVWQVATGDSISYPYLIGLKPRALPGHRPAAWIQVIHNMDSGSVRVSLDDVERVSKLDPEKATPYLAIPSSAPFTIKLISLQTGTVLTQYFNGGIAAGESVLIYATGGGEDAELLRLTDTKRQADNAEQIDVVFVHGAEGFGPLSLDQVAYEPPHALKRTLASNIQYGDKGGYEGLDFERLITFKVRAGNTVVGEYTFNFEGQKGKAFKIVAKSQNGAKIAQALSLVAVDATGRVVQPGLTTSDQGENASDLPSEFALHGNFPNPFNPSTTLSFDLPESAKVRVQVVDVLGRVVMDIDAGALSAGARRNVALDASRLASGIYLYRVVATSATRTYTAGGRFTLIK